MWLEVFINQNMYIYMYFVGQIIKFLCLIKIGAIDREALTTHV